MPGKVDNNDVKSAKRLVELEKKLKCRKQEVKLYLYNNTAKIHLKQVEFHKTAQRGRWVFGGNRTGKTECGAVEAVWWLRGCHPYKNISRAVEGWVVSPTSEVQRDVAQRKLLSYLPKEWIKSITMKSGSVMQPEAGVVDTIEVESVTGGISRISFKSCEQGRERFQGASLDFIWFDEEPDSDVFTECRMRLMDKLGSFWVTMTPLSGLDWIYDSVIANSADPEYWHIFISWEDNPFLNKKEIERMRMSLSEDELDAREKGEFVSRNGLVYKEFDRKVHVTEPMEIPDSWKKMISIDPGLINPLSAHWYACSPDGCIYVVAEHYAAERDIEWHAERIKEICKRLNWPVNSEGKYNVLMDSAANSRSLVGDLSVAQAFSKYGFSPMTRVNKSMYAGISKVKEYLKIRDGKAKFQVFECCREMIREFGQYRYRDDKPLKKNDHAMDELRYFLMWFVPSNPACEKTAIQRDKERLARKISAENRRARFRV